MPENGTKPSTAILVAVIGAVASILVALISSGIFANSNVKESVKSLKINDVEVWETMLPNKSYTPERGGIVIAIAKANPQHRAVYIDGYIENELVASAAAQDCISGDCPSILNGSFTMPVPKGKEWIVKVPTSETSQVQIKWFTTKSQVTMQE